MKNLFLRSFLILSIISVGFSSCKKEDDPVLTTGGLVVKVQLDGSTGYLTGVNVGLSTSQDNLDDGVYLQDKVTDSNGKVDFGELNPGNYYYDCYYEVGSNDYYGEGQVQIIAGTDLELTLTLE